MYIFKCCKYEINSLEKFNEEYNKNNEGKLICPKCKKESVVYHIIDNFNDLLLCRGERLS